MKIKLISLQTQFAANVSTIIDNRDKTSQINNKHCANKQTANQQQLHQHHVGPLCAFNGGRSLIKILWLMVIFE